MRPQLSANADPESLGKILASPDFIDTLETRLRERHGAVFGKCTGRSGHRLSDPVDRWLSHIEIATTGDDCWPWIGSRFISGYGRFSNYRGSTETKVAHRWGYTQLIGEAPKELYVCHTCDNPPCCRPRHWFLGTPADNMTDKTRKGRQARGRPMRLTPPKGELNGRAILSQSDVEEIRQLSETMTRTALAQKFGIGRTQVLRIIRGESW